MKIVTLLIALGFVCAAVPVHAGPCSKEIDMVTKFLGGSGGGASVPRVGSAAPAVSSTNSTSALSAVTGGGATAGALGSGTSAASPEALGAVQQAQTADAAGDETSCMEYIGKAK